MLSDRRRRILNALIEEYVSTATPVSSKALVGNYGLGVSSATVRNELYFLEENGYVESPHVSSGRIPTDVGYRTFVDQLLDQIHQSDASNAKQADGAAYVENDNYSELRKSASELDAVLKETSRILNRFTDCLAVVVAPRLTKLALKQISLVPMDSHHVIAVIVVKDGRVLNRVIDLKHEVSAEELRVLERLLSEQYEVNGAFDPLVNAANRVESAARQRAFLTDSVCQDALATLIEQIDELLFEGERDRIHVNGLETLFAQPELQKMSLSMGFARLLDDDLRMFRLLGDFLAEDGVFAKIGHENVDDDMSDVSIIASRYGEDAHEGVVAVVGPTRMNYTKVIDAVRKASDFLEDATSEDRS